MEKEASIYWEDSGWKDNLKVSEYSQAEQDMYM